MDEEKDIQQLTSKVANANRIIGRWYNTIGLGHVMMTLGHVSARIPGRDLFLIKGRSPENDLMIKASSDTIVTVNMNGTKVSGPSNISIPGEIELHSHIYRARKDVTAICHAHPHYAVICSLNGVKIKPMCNEGIDLFPIPVYNNNALISTDYHGREVVKALGKAKACLLRGHGAVTVANSLPYAVLRMMYLEEQSRLNTIAFTCNGKNYLGIPAKQAKGYLEFYESELPKRPGRQLVQRGMIEQNLWNHLVEQEE